jgi:hypothetical protein
MAGRYKKPVQYRKGPPIKAGQPEPSLHLGTTCETYHIYEDLNESSSARPAAGDSSEPKQLAGRLLFQFRGFFFRRGFFTRRGDFNSRKDSIVRLSFCKSKVFSNLLFFCKRKDFSIRLIFGKRKDFSICLIFSKSRDFLNPLAFSSYKYLYIFSVFIFLHPLLSMRQHLIGAIISGL